MKVHNFSDDNKNMKYNKIYHVYVHVWVDRWVFSHHLLLAKITLCDSKTKHCIHSHSFVVAVPPDSIASIPKQCCNGYNHSLQGSLTPITAPLLWAPLTRPTQSHTPSRSHKKLCSLPICMETASTFEQRGCQVVSTNCGHIFCSACLRRTVTELHRCPTCRKRLTLKQYHTLYL